MNLPFRASLLCSGLLILSTSGWAQMGPPIGFSAATSSPVPPSQAQGARLKQLQQQMARAKMARLQSLAATNTSTSSMTGTRPGMGQGISQMGIAQGSASSLGRSALMGQAMQNGVRPEDLRGPTASECAMRELSGKAPSLTNRQDAGGRARAFTDASSLQGQNRSGDIYGDCDSSMGLSGLNARSVASMQGSAFDKRTGTLKAAKDGYVNRTATSSMMPKKIETSFDPVTGMLKPPKVMSAYQQIYQGQQ